MFQNRCRSTLSKSKNGGNANVKVMVRIRPVNEAEACEKHPSVTQAVSDHMLVFDPKVSKPPGFLPTNHRDITRRRFKDLKYAFDYVFGPNASNREVFEQTTHNIVDGVLNGYNCSVFAYGATGAGKTHTMLGNEREPGVIYYTMIDLYRQINEQKAEKNFDVAVSYSEVYNEQVRDLLMPRGSLPIREDKTVGVIIAGLSLHKPKTAEELLHMLHFGNKNRTQHPTDTNAESSRSHAVFQVFVNQHDKLTSISSGVKMAKMCLVDLAGSERANQTTNRGARFREGANINRSLLALGNVINALADNKFKGHIPYRDSKLTRLLKDSLGGNCQTVMIAAVSPSIRSFEDTYNTLRYADRAKHIRSDLKKNVVNVDFHIANYKKYVQELEKENQELRKTQQELKETLELKESSNTAVISPIIRQFQERLADLFKARKEIRRTQMASDGAMRELKWKVARKEQSIRRVKKLTESMHIIGKQSRIVERMKRRIEKEEQSFANSSRKLEDQDKAIYNLHNALGQNDQCSEILDLNVRIHSAESNLYDSAMYLAFVKKMARAQDRQTNVNEKLILCLIQLVKKQHNILLNQNLLSTGLSSWYEQCCYMVEERGVAWVQNHEDGASPNGAGDMTVNTCGSPEEPDELCISDIIDIQVPKLLINSHKVEVSSDSTNTLNPGSLKMPQRVPKTALSSKPSSNVTEGLNTHPSLMSYSGRELAMFQSGNQHTKEPTVNKHLLGNTSLSKNPVEALNMSLDTCSKRFGMSPRKSNPVQTAISPFGNSFSPKKAEDCAKKGSDKSNCPRAITHIDQPLSQCSSSCAPAMQRSSTPGARKCLWGGLPETKVQGGSRIQFPDQTAVVNNTAKSNESVSADDLNKTFELKEPAVLNVPCADSSQRHPQNKDRTPIPQSTTSPVLGKKRNLPFREKQMFFSKLENAKDELINKAPKSSPRDRFKMSGSKNSWTASPGQSSHSISRPSETEDRRLWPVTDGLVKQNGKRKTSFTQSAGSKVPSPAPHPRQSTAVSSVVKSHVVTHSHSAQHVSRLKTTGINSVTTFECKDGSDEKQRMLLGSCSNSNNVNTSSTAESPKSYADAVMSPALSKTPLSKMSPLREPLSLQTPVISNQVGEAHTDCTKISDLSSNPHMAHIVSSLKKHGLPSLMEAFSTKPQGTPDKLRQPLKQLSLNSATLSPLISSESSNSSNCDSPRNRSKLKIRANFNKERKKQHRAITSNPYLKDQIKKVKKFGLPSTLDMPLKEKKLDVVNAVLNTVPNYMQPTFATAQRTQTLGKEKFNQSETTKTLSRRTTLQRNQYSFSFSSMKETVDGDCKSKRLF